MLKKTYFFLILIRTLLSAILCLSSLSLNASTHSFKSFTQNQSYINSVNEAVLEKEVVARMDRVAEFKFIRDVAEKYGVDIYLFGGTASAYAHYVRWDILRENGDPRFQPERFDYFFDNIYRSNQDLDIVVDSDSETADKIASDLKAKFNHFVGDKEAWEVRLLREQKKDKQPLLNDPDFLNQHTDSNSIGLIKVNSLKVNNNKKQAFFDLRDWSSKQSLYLKDISSATITYLFSDKHKTTSRYKAKKNPPILSAIRYLAKATQYELTLKDADLKKIKDVIQSTDVENLSTYSKHKLSEFALKALLNSPDVEYAWNLLEHTGARQIAIKADDNQTSNNNSVSWWLSKEPLRSSEVVSRTNKKGKTAKELGIKIVAHETNSFQAFDNITRSTKGRANVFISRASTPGEAAVYGNGFYTKAGKTGARDTGITIRFKVHPKATEGIDFIYNKSNDFLVFTNKNALELIAEKINIDILEYFKLLQSGGLTNNDKGLLNRIRTRISKTNTASKKELDQVYKLVKKDFEDNGVNSILAPEWFRLNMSLQYSELLDLAYKQLSHDDMPMLITENIFSLKHWMQYPNAAEYVDKLIDIMPNERNIHRSILVNILSDKIWENNPKLPDLIEKIISYSNRNIKVYLTEEVLSKEYWANHPRGPELLKKMIVGKNGANREIITNILSKDYWMKNPETIKIIEAFIDKSRHNDTILEHVLSHSYWATSTEGALLLDKIVKYGKNNLFIFRHILSKKYWTDTPKGFELLESFIENNSDSHIFVLKHVLAYERWAKHPKGGELLEAVTKDRQKVPNAFVAQYILNKESWAKHPVGLKLLKKILSDNDANKNLVNYVFSREQWVEHPDIIKIMEGVIAAGNANVEIATVLLTKHHWRKHPNGFKILLYLIQHGDADKYIIRDTLSRDSFIKHPKSLEIIKSILNKQNRTANEHLALFIFAKKAWLEVPENFLFVRELLLSKDITPILMTDILQGTSFVNHPESSEALRALISKPDSSGRPDSNKNLIWRALLSDTWREHHELFSLLEVLAKAGGADEEILTKLFLKSSVLSKDKAPKLIIQLYQNKSLSAKNTLKLLSQTTWLISKPEGAQYLEHIILKGELDDEVKKILNKESSFGIPDYLWKNHKQYSYFMKLLNAPLSLRSEIKAYNKTNPCRQSLKK